MDGTTATFTPRADYFGNAGFSYRVADSHGAVNVGFVAITLLPTDDLPIAVSDAGFSVYEDSFIDLDPAVLLSNDYDPDGDELSFLGMSRGELLDNGFYRITPFADFFGEFVVSYSISDASGIPISTTVTIDVLPLEDAPVAVDDTLTMVEDTPLTIFASELLNNDFDVDRQALLLNGIIATNGVTITEDGFGRLTITPDENRNGLATFDYEITDSTGLTDTARVTITLQGVNDAPDIADAGPLSGTEDQPFSAMLSPDIFSDVDGDELLVGLRGEGNTPLPSWFEFQSNQSDHFRHTAN